MPNGWQLADAYEKDLLGRFPVQQNASCPVCRADLGQPCWRKNGKPQKRNHRERVELLLEVHRNYWRQVAKRERQHELELANDRERARG